MCPYVNSYGVREAARAGDQGRPQLMKSRSAGHFERSASCCDGECSSEDSFWAFIG